MVITGQVSLQNIRQMDPPEVSDDNPAAWISMTEEVPIHDPVCLVCYHVALTLRLELYFIRRIQAKPLGVLNLLCDGQCGHRYQVIRLMLAQLHLR